MKHKLKIRFLIAVCFILIVALVGVVSVAHKNNNVHEISVKFVPSSSEFGPIHAAISGSRIEPPEKLQHSFELPPSIIMKPTQRDLMEATTEVEQTTEKTTEKIIERTTEKTTEKMTTETTPIKKSTPTKLFVKLTTKQKELKQVDDYDYYDPTPRPRNKTDEEKLPVYYFAGQQYVHEDTHKELLKNNSQYAKDIQVLIDNDYIVYMPNKTLYYPEVPDKIPLFEGTDGRLYVNESVVHTEYVRPNGPLNKLAKLRIDQIVKGIIHYLPRDNPVTHIKHPQPHIIVGETFHGIEHTKLANKYYNYK